MEEDRPGPHRERTRRRRPHDLRQDGSGAHGRPKADVPPACVVGLEEDRAALEEPNLADRVVGEDVPALVVGGSDCHPAEPTAMLDVVEDRLDPLVGEVGGEREDRGVHLPREPAAVDR